MLCVGEVDGLDVFDQHIFTEIKKLCGGKRMLLFFSKEDVFPLLHSLCCVE